MADLERMKRALVAADAAGDVEAARTLAQAIRSEMGSAKPAPGGRQGGLGDVLKETFTLGLNNEMAGAARAVGPLLRGDFAAIPEAYSSGRNESVARTRQARDAAPVAAFGMDMVGGMANPLARLLPGSQAGAGMLANTARSAAGGALGGAAYGFNTAEGDLGDRGEGALTGGLVGGAVGAAAPALVEGASKGLRYMADQAITRVGQNKGANQATVAARKVAEALQRDGIDIGADYGPNLPNTVQGRLAAIGPDAALLDVGTNARGLAAATARVPGQGKATLENFVTARQEGTRNATTGALEGGQYGRVSQILDDVTPNRLRSTVDGISASQKNAASPFYDDAFSTNTAIQSPWLDDLMKDPDAMKGFARGLKIQMKEHMAAQQKLPPAQRTPFDPNDFAVVGFNEAGDPILGKAPSLRTFDSVKRGLDAMISEQTDPVTGKVTEMGRALIQQKQALVSELKGLTGGDEGAYAKALDSWAGPERLKGAARDGFNFLRGGENAGVDDLAKRVGKMTPDQREALRVGAVQALRDKIGGKVTRADVTKALKDIPDLEARVRIAFGDDATFKRYIDRLTGESTMFEGYAAIKGNSLTDARRLASDDLNGDPGGMAQDMVGIAANPLNPMNYIRAGVRYIGDQRAKMATPEPVRAQLAQMLAGRNTAPLNQAMQSVQMNAADRARLARALMGGGAVTGGYTAP